MQQVPSAAIAAIINLRGPKARLYLRGVRLTYWSTLMLNSDGVWPVFSVTGYSNMIATLFAACHE